MLEAASETQSEALGTGHGAHPLKPIRRCEPHVDDRTSLGSSASLQTCGSLQAVLLHYYPIAAWVELCVV